MPTLLSETQPSAVFSLPKFEELSILCSSPESLLKARAKHIESRPIKGTTARLENPAEDLNAQSNLLNSEKDKAELLMIIDLIRNDLGKIAKTGSVTVPTLIDLESYRQVHHLVSTVTATLDDETHHISAFKALFPGGSITGTPKKQAMRIIHALEEEARGPYTGSIGYFGFHGASEMNIAIRTAYTHNNTLRYHSGGGITTASDPDSEWEETLSKAKGLSLSFKQHLGSEISSSQD